MSTSSHQVKACAIPFLHHSKLASIKGNSTNWVRLITHFLIIASEPVCLQKNFPTHWRAFNRCNWKAFLRSTVAEANNEKIRCRMCANCGISLNNCFNYGTLVVTIDYIFAQIYFFHLTMRFQPTLMDFLGCLRKCSVLQFIIVSKVTNSNVPQSLSISTDSRSSPQDGWMIEFYVSFPQAMKWMMLMPPTLLTAWAKPPSPIPRSL